VRSAKFRGDRYETPARQRLLIEDAAGNLIDVVRFGQARPLTRRSAAARAVSACDGAARVDAIV